jgi:hypothetical protein
MSFAHVLEVASPLAPDELVDPGSICEVEFSMSARRRADIEFFNRIGRERSSMTGSFRPKAEVQMCAHQPLLCQIAVLGPPEIDAFGR